MTSRLRRAGARRGVATALAVLVASAAPAAARASDASDASSAARAAADDDDDGLLLPDVRLDYAPSDGVLRRTLRRTANESYGLLNATLSDGAALVASPLDWRAREWLVLLGVAGAATGLVFLADDEIRDAAQGSRGFRNFGDDVRFLGNGPGFLALTGGFLASGVLFRDDEIETASMLIEASALGYGSSLALKWTAGRERPGPLVDAREFHPFSGDFSMPSGEATHAFALATIVSQRYRHWPVWVLSYGAATTVALGRISSDGHWASDVLVGAAIGTFVGRTVARLHAERAERAAERERLGLAPARDEPTWSLAASRRGVLWTVRF